MKINFNYNKRDIDYVSGYIFKGKSYRCSYVRYRTLYENYSPGTENVEMYFFQPKKEVRASTLVLHGLGSRNIKFLLWLGPHLANVGVSTTILILPGNYTRVEDNSMSGRSYLYPDINVMYRFWEHGVVDTLSTIDLLEQSNYWKKNNIILGYCLGGMISTMVGVLDSRINHLLFMTTGGHIPRILHQSPATAFVRRMFDKGFKADFDLDNQERLYNIYDEEFSKVKSMSLDEIVSNDEIHPLFKIDPISYAHLLDMKKVTFIDAYFDSTLPIQSRKVLYNEMYGANRKVLPISHVNWLPFGYFLAKYILHKLNINAKEAKKALLTREVIENPLEK
ncbi:alpha/beta hydrolase [Clostridium sp. Cult1]|uniref:alpha/beta hydrolase n=1 Tax=Clostridium sp. Cult1 TaxID=2079002 RepID=UPI001F3ECD9C|nr:alpha/beta hydrolase [Clostridium sp. Cult1]MCF6462860.1 alpha/beta hydrolase [Clostridium sp. Cult1]